MAGGEYTLDIPPGINSDDTSYSATGRWTDGSNVRFRLGKPQVIGGWQRMYSSYVLPGPPRCVFAYNLSTGGRRIIYGTSTNLYSTTSIINPGSLGLSLGGNTAYAWALGSWGDDLIALPYRVAADDGFPSGGLYRSSPPLGALTLIAGAPLYANWMIVTPERQILMIGTQEEVSGLYNPLCIRGCDIEDYTDWTTSPTNNAFEYILEGTGRVRGGCMVGSYVAIWTSTALHLGQFIGDPGQTYRFEKVAEDCGLLNPRCVAITATAVYWLGVDLRIYRWAGPGSVPERLPCPVLKDLQDNADVSNGISSLREKYFACRVSRFDEVWFFYQDDRDATSVTRYIAFNEKEGVWFKGSLPWEEMACSAAFNSYVFDQNMDTDVIAIARTGEIYRAETGTSAAGSALTWSLTSADFYVGNGDREVEVQTIFPDFEAQTGNVSVTLYGKRRPQSTATTKGPYTLATTATKKDTRLSGNLISVKFSSAGSTSSFMRLGKPRFSFKLKGSRP
jgi:hypothetical protein